jgi:hypothetical protein
VDTANVIDVESHMVVSNSIAIVLERDDVAKWKRTRGGAPNLGNVRASNEMGELDYESEGNVLWGHVIRWVVARE